jgi:protein tyrosine kinase modulator
MPTQPRQFADAAASDHSIPEAGRDWADDDLGPAWYVVALQRWWLLIFIGALVGGAIAFWYATGRPLLYEGVTTLLVVPPSQAGGAQVTPATFRAIVENLTLASEVIDELKLQETLTPHRFLERALVVDEIRGTNIVKVKVTLGDPKLAAEASRRLAQKAILLAQQITQQEGASVQEQLRRHLNEAAQRMRQAERELLEYKQRAQVDLIKADTDAQLKERGDLLPLVIEIEAERARLAAAENEIKRQQPVLQTARTPAAEDALRRIQSQPDSTRDANKNRTDKSGGDKGGGDKSEGDKARVDKGAVDAQHLDLTNPFVNPVYQTLDFQIATSRTRIAALEKERDQVLNVKKLGGTELGQLSELYRREIEQARLKAGYDLAVKVHADLALRYEQSRTQPVGNTSQLQVVDQALPPDDPVARKRLQHGMLGAGIGFIVTALITLLWESGRQRQREA